MGEVAVDGTVLAVTSLVTIATALLVGVLPAWLAPQVDLSAELRSGTRGSPPRQDRLRRVLVVGEVALALVLLISSGLLIRTLGALRSVRPGFDAQAVLTFRSSLPFARYKTGADRLELVHRIERGLGALPGVVGVGTTTQLPLTGSGSLQPYAYDEETARHWESVTADGRNVSPEFFRTMGVALVAGRFFTEADADAPPVIIVDADLARRVWPGRSAVGQRLQVAPAGDPAAFAEVVGVIEHMQLHDLTRPVHPQIWRPLRGNIRPQLAFAVRVAGDPTRLAGAVREVVRSIDAGPAVTDLVPMTHYVDKASAPVRLSVLVMTVFGTLALLLAGIGVYAVVAYSVAQRTPSTASGSRSARSRASSAAWCSPRA